MNRYTIIGQLGDGSFGSVSKARHAQTGDVVAVKKMKQRFHSWEECLELREIQSLRKIQHPNLIKLREVVRENNELFLVFEYCEKNIFQMQHQRAEQGGAKPFNDREIRSIMCQVLLGLQAIHKNGFMHRDLKPENLLVMGDHLKIADFGLAKEIRSRPPFTEYVSTRWYRAPELVLHSDHYNSPIDIWACGVIFAELYLGRPLFPGTSESDQLFKICSVVGAPSPGEWDEGYQLARRLNLRFPTITPTPIRQLLDQAPPAAVDLIEKMLRFNPHGRPTATQCLQDPYFTDNVHNSAMYAGVSTGQPHNPFQGMASSTSNCAVGLSSACVGGPSPTTTTPSSLMKYAGLFEHGNRSPLNARSDGESTGVVRSVPQRPPGSKSITVELDATDEFNF